MPSCNHLLIAYFSSSTNNAHNTLQSRYFPAATLGLYQLIISIWIQNYLSNALLNECVPCTLDSNIIPLGKSYGGK